MVLNWLVTFVPGSVRCNSALCLLYIFSFCSSAPLICTASEDTTLSIGLIQYTRGQQTWTPLARLKGHLSSVRCVAVLPRSTIYPGSDSESQVRDNGDLTLDKRDLPMTELSFLLFSGGGRAELRAWNVKVMSPSNSSNLENVLPQIAQNNTEETTEETTCRVRDFDNLQIFNGNPTSQKLNENVDVSQVTCSYQHLTTHFLGESRHKQRRSAWKTRKLQLDPETRVMDVEATPISQVIGQAASADASVSYVVSLAGSDGLLRYTFSRF